MYTKIKIVSESQPCRHCGGKLAVQHHEPGWQPKRKSGYYFDWWLRCTQCGYLYMVEAAKRQCKPVNQPGLFSVFS